MVSGTSSIPTRFSGRLAFQFLLPTLVALAGVLAVGVPFASHVVAQRQEAALGERLLRETRLVSEAIPWEEGPRLDAACAASDNVDETCGWETIVVELAPGVAPGSGSKPRIVYG